MKHVDLSKVKVLMNSFLCEKKLSNRKAILIRSAENQGNLSGTICGWTDMKLTDYGRRQAFMLNQVLEENLGQFHEIHSSDLQRCIDTSFYALGFPSKNDFSNQTNMLREMNFGTQEGLHFDGLSKAEKEKISSPDF